MRSLLLRSWAVQGASASVLLVQNALVPAVIGAESFGRAVSLVVLPLLLQGMIEPMANGVAIAASSRDDHDRWIARAGKHLRFMAPIVVGACTVFALQRGGTTVEVLLVAGFATLALVNTVARAFAFAHLRLGIIVGHYLAALAGTFLTIPFLHSTGALGFLAMLCVVQLAILAVLLQDGLIRENLLLALRAATTSNRIMLRSTYMGNLAARLAQLALGPGILLLASLQLGAAQLAEFRLCQTLLGMLVYLAPGNATVIQALGRRAALDEREPRRRHAAGLLLISFAITFVGAGVVWLVYPLAMYFVLDIQDATGPIRWLTLFGPFYVMTPLLAAYLLGGGEERFVLVFSLGVTLIVAAISWTAGVATAFMVGTMVFFIGYGLAARRLAARP